MKKSLFVLILSALAVGVAHADYPPVVVEGNIVIDYSDTRIDATELAIDPTIQQFNHEAPVTATVDMSHNGTIDGNINLDATALGNNVNITTGAEHNIIQGNQVGGTTASVLMHENRLSPDVEVFIDATAVNNNINSDGNVNALQFNYDSPATASIVMEGNRFGNIPRDPDLEATAMGNALTAPSVGEALQLNRDSAISASVVMDRNRGAAIGPVNINATAVGNNINIAPVE